MWITLFVGLKTYNYIYITLLNKKKLKNYGTIY